MGRFIVSDFSDCTFLLADPTLAMSLLDWIILLLSLVGIAGYGLYKSRGNTGIDSYLRGSHSTPWFMVGLSVMATQASAITFLSAPGQAYFDGMRFVQYYFGLPIAMVVISLVFLPIYHKLNLYTAYEFLEQRFDLKTRMLTSFLFLIQRGLASGLTLYAPSLILSALLGWNIYYTNLLIGGVVVIYTVGGGSRAVSFTHLQQMLIIFLGMLLAGIWIVKLLPDDIGFSDAIALGGKLGKMNIIDTHFDLSNKYNLWSGLLGGFFLALSYFGTDQSQVSRYLSAKDLKESRTGLLMNGILKVPMQFFILLIGVLLFVFYQIHPAPLNFNSNETGKVSTGIYANDWKTLEDKNTQLAQSRKKEILLLHDALKNESVNDVATHQENLKALMQQTNELRQASATLMEKDHKNAETNDTNYLFLRFVLDHLPHGLIGLLIAVIFAASMQSKSAELNALAACTIVDIYKRSIRKEETESHYLKASRISTAAWGLFAIVVAMFANRLGSLIEAVNVLGSLFYGTILGIFLVAFFQKNVRGGHAFYAALIAEALVIYLYFFTTVSFLWFNLIGALLVMGLSALFHLASPKAKA